MLKMSLGSTRSARRFARKMRQHHPRPLMVGGVVMTGTDTRRKNDAQLDDSDGGVIVVDEFPHKAWQLGHRLVRGCA